MTKHLIFWIIFYKIHFPATNRFFFLDNHRKYIEKTIKPIVKLKYKDIYKKKTDLEKKEKKIDLLQQTIKRLPEISYYTTIWCQPKILKGHFLYK